MPSECGSNSQVRRFSGAGEDAARQYFRWKRWAKAYIVTQRSCGVVDEALGPMIYCLLDGIAERAVDKVEIEDLEVAGGEQILFDILDQRFPEIASQDKIGEALDDVFKLRVERNERTAGYTGRCREAFERASREGITFSSLAR